MSFWFYHSIKYLYQLTLEMNDAHKCENDLFEDEEIIPADQRLSERIICLLLMLITLMFYDFN